MRLTYTKANDLAQLSDELLAAIPALRPVVGPNGRGQPVMVAQGQGTAITLDVPDATDPAAVAAVVNAHVPDQARDPAAIQAADDADLTTIRGALSSLTSDRALMLGAGTLADVKAAVARLDGAFLVLARVLRRRGSG